MFIENPLLLARLHVALTGSIHYLFPPVSMGLMFLNVLGYCLGWFNTQTQRWLLLWFTWFSLLGLATGWMMELDFVQAWQPYAAYVGAIFYQAFGRNGLYSFYTYLLSLGLLWLGHWRRWPRSWLGILSIILCISTFAIALWIVWANSWMQTPAGYRIFTDEVGVTRAFLSNRWAMLLNPSALPHITHTFFAAILAGCSWLLFLKRVPESVISKSLTVAKISMAGQLLTGLWLGQVVHVYQPSKAVLFSQPTSLAGALALFMLVCSIVNMWLLWQKKGLRWLWPLTTLASVAGWGATEVGRQPWVVYGLLKTTQGLQAHLQGPVLLETLQKCLVMDGLLCGLFIWGCFWLSKRSVPD